ncbi:GAF domain-like protein [Dioszegia hungarica]|uniref:GAF domain-like protein n=1 Tax=Dioszegia hungarica TaxID=4972 RepID=A0AA38LUE1_9TREE|nr:GAF domain-like protein [Dioszegia hungarica]KAI9634799.1 GAF domain-like protein [Dioszegia hungarica]
MPHADSAYVPEDIKTKEQFYHHVTEQITALLNGSRYWVSNLAQVASLLSHSFLSSPLYGYTTVDTPKVNWVGFYLHPPPPAPTQTTAPLLVGPYVGRPACISITPRAGRGVCADAFLTGRTVVVDDVEAYPGHIACDGETKSEIVVPLRIPLPGDEDRVIGVLDLDSTSLGTFDEADRKGLEEIVAVLRDACDWS